jgi:hypothetical protein
VNISIVSLVCMRPGFRNKTIKMEEGFHEHCTARSGQR